MIQIQGLEKSFPDGHLRRSIFAGLDLTLNLGQMVSILGPSGCGKSTLLAILGGLESYDAGHVSVAGHDLRTLSADSLAKLRADYISYVFQFHHLLPEYSLIDNVALPLRLKGESLQVARNEAQKILDDLGLQGRYKALVGDLSGGERQRAAIARALVSKPLYVLADEPSGNLDPENAFIVFDLLQAYAVQHQALVMVVTHDHHLARHAQQSFVVDQQKLKSL